MGVTISGVGGDTGMTMLGVGGDTGVIMSGVETDGPRRPGMPMPIDGAGKSVARTGGRIGAPSGGPPILIPVSPESSAPGVSASASLAPASERASAAVTPLAIVTNALTVEPDNELPFVGY